MLDETEIIGGESVSKPETLEEFVEHCEKVFKLLHETARNQANDIFVSDIENDPDYEHKRVCLEFEIKEILQAYQMWRGFWPWFSTEETTTLNTTEVSRSDSVNLEDLKQQLNTVKCMAHALYCGILGIWYPEQDPAEIIDPKEFEALLHGIRVMLGGLDDERIEFILWLQTTATVSEYRFPPEREPLHRCN